jgi:transcriptional regulator with PAS, ATPase and Fis domain
MKAEHTERSEVLLLALEQVVGHAFVIDEQLRVVGKTPDLSRVFGPLDIGVSAPKQICGAATVRTMAEALARGEAMSSRIQRVLPDERERAFYVRAVPLKREDKLHGFLILVDDDATNLGAHAGAMTRYGIITQSPRMKALVDDIERVAQSDASVLVRGETGSGKELVARAIHAASDRKAGPFVAINCAALPAQLLESELFGHVRGAFTGAVRDSPGLMHRADAGTILLDEIAELPLELQAKLLRVLEERSVIPVGGRDPVPIDVRFVSATHRSLRDAVAQGRFRADLMYRIRVIPLFLPSLRERKGDVPLIVQHLVARFNERGKRQVERVTQGALEALDGYDWPGNVRELSNAIEYAFAIGRGPVITEAELPPEIVTGESAQRDDEGPHKIPELPPIATLDPTARRILRALERAGGNKRRAAESLGMSRTTFWRKLRELSLES